MKNLKRAFCGFSKRIFPHLKLASFMLGVACDVISAYPEWEEREEEEEQEMVEEDDIDESDFVDGFLKVANPVNERARSRSR